MAQICSTCIDQDEIRTYNINGRCDRCSGTDWIEEEDSEVIKLTSEELAYLRNILGKKARSICKTIYSGIPEYEQERMIEDLEFVKTLRQKIQRFMHRNGI